MRRTSKTRSLGPPLGPARPRAASGFSLVELLVVIGIITLLLGLLLGFIVRARNAGASTKCLSHLRAIGSALHMAAADNNNRFPDPLETDQSWEKILTQDGKYLADAKVFQCPADEEVFPTVGSSYDWRDTGIIATTLAGQAVTKAPDGAVLAFDALPGWHTKGKMNVVRVGGAVEPMDRDECLRDLEKPLVQLPKLP
jgi:prepilin-type N-terminal cleavage/methylation domain-containing protein